MPCGTFAPFLSFYAFLSYEHVLTDGRPVNAACKDDCIIVHIFIKHHVESYRNDGERVTHAG